MSSLILISATCWLCALVILPRRLHPAAEVAALPANRPLNWQQVLVLLALCMAVVLLLVLLAAVPLRAVRDAPTVPPCWLAAPDDLRPCGPAQQGDAWVMEPSDGS
jgi:hypothetical protein